MNAQKPVIAIDLGGTKIAASVVYPDGRITCLQRFPTMAEQGLKKVLQHIYSAIDATFDASGLDNSKIGGIGMSVPGPIDAKNGIITTSPNLPGWNNVPMCNLIRERFHVKMTLAHDASAAAIAEHRFGAGKGSKDMIYVTVSTGIGGGIIIDNKLYSGMSGSAGEIGHMTIDAKGPVCNCGNTGCLEVLASGSAMERRTRERLTAGELSSITTIVNNNLAAVTAETIDQAARDGDKLANEIIQEAANYLGIGLVNLVNVLNPEMIIIGGGVTNMGDRLLAPAVKLVKQRAFKLPANAVRIVRAALGGNAELLGAAIVAFD